MLQQLLKLLKFLGYGNIVPVTVSGKIACVIFALIGAPLAIITIGDLGKFLSECTIWFYTKMKEHKKRIKNNWKLYRLRKGKLLIFWHCVLKCQHFGILFVNAKFCLKPLNNIKIMQIFSGCYGRFRR